MEVFRYCFSVISGMREAGGEIGRPVVMATGHIGEVVVKTGMR